LATEGADIQLSRVQGGVKGLNLQAKFLRV